MIGAAAGIGMGANIIGGGIQMLGAKWANDAMFRAYQEALAQAGRSAGQATKYFATDAVPYYGAPNFGNQLAASQAKRQQGYEQQTPMAFNMSASPVDKARYDMMAQQRAGLTGYSDVMADRGIRTLQDARVMDWITNKAVGNASLLPYNMYKAQHSQDRLKLIGQMISMIGGQAPNIADIYGAPQMKGWGQQQFGMSGGNPAVAPEMYGPGMQ